jgi:uncharacterized phage infection (PIP) family protein YhgE
MFALIALALSACGSADVSQIEIDAGKFMRAASGSLQDIPGTIRDTVELGKQGIDGVKKTVDGVTQKVDQVQKGIGQVKDGIDSLKNGQKLLEGVVYGAMASSSR